VLSAFCEALGGLALFLYGMHLAGQGLQGITQLGAFLSRMTRGRLRGVVSGVGLAFALQSSSAATVILVSLSEASLLRLSSAFACALGAGIGTALTVEIISFDPSNVIFLFAASGVALTVLTSSTVSRGIGRIILGFSLLFLGMDFLQRGTGFLLGSPSLESWIGHVLDSVFLSFLTATGTTLLVQSSAAVLAIVMALANEGRLLPCTALPMILGANLGTCITALIASAGTTRRGRSVALWHLGFKLIGALCLLPLCRAFPGEVGPWSLNEVTPRWIAHGHALYNVLLVLLFLPWTRHVAVLASRWVKSDSRGEGLVAGVPPKRLPELENILLGEAEGLSGLLEKVGDVISMGTMQAGREIEKTAKEMEGRLSSAVSALLEMEGSLKTEEDKREALMRMAFTLSGMVRQIRDDYLGVVVRMREEGIHFSIEGEKEVLSFMKSCGEYMTKTVRLMRRSAKRDPECDLPSERKDLEGDLERLRHQEGVFYMKHFKRLSEGIRESQRTGSEHAELMAKSLSLCRELTDVWRWFQTEGRKR